MTVVDLPTPPSHYRPDLVTWREDGIVRFETKAECLSEDAMRVQMLRGAAKRYPDQIDPASAERLAIKLECGHQWREPTLASCRDLYPFRINATGSTWQLFDSTDLDVRTATVIPVSWEFSPTELEHVDPRKLLNRLLSALHKMGSGEADGWLIAALHGEYDPVSDRIRLHAHLVVAGGMIKVVDRLRELPNYRTSHTLPNGERSFVYRRVRIGRLPLVNLPDPFTYLWQRYWPSKPILVKDGRLKRLWMKARIDEPVHSLVLLWLDRWTLTDMTLLIKLRATRNGLVETQR